MNTALISKIAGWGQFLFTTLGQAFTGGFPTSPIGWVSLAGSLLAAIGIHAASNTDGAK